MILYTPTTICNCTVLCTSATIYNYMILHTPTTINNCHSYSYSLLIMLLSLAPLNEAIYSTYTDLLASLHAYTKENDYAVTIAHSKKDKNNEVKIYYPQYIKNRTNEIKVYYFQCVKSGTL